MFERKKDSPEFKKTLSFELVMPKDHAEAVDYYSDYLEISQSQFTLEALDFEILFRSMKKSRAILEAEINKGVNVMHYAELLEEFEIGCDESGEKVAIPIYLDEEGEALLMWGVAFHYDGKVEDVRNDLQSWNQQKGYIWTTLSKAIKHYIARLDAEHDGWKLYINSNQSYDNQERIEPRFIERNQGE